MSKSNVEGNTPLDRLQQIPMGAHERLLAQAHLARAEVMADVLIDAMNLAKRVLRAAVVRPFQRAAAAFT